MIYEKWDVRFDIEKLRSHLETHVLPLEPVAQSPAFAGWSVLSSTGSYQDGWHQGHLTIKKTQSVDEIKSGLEQIGAKGSRAYIIPTEICHGYLKSVIESIASHGLQPRRARIIRLSPMSSCSWHRDSAENTYAVRLHVPLVTNPGCFFETREDRAHLSADGHAYFLKVNREHRVINDGGSYRYHLVMDVTDDAGLTQYHRYIPSAPAASVQNSQSNA